MAKKKLQGPEDVMGAIYDAPIADTSLSRWCHKHRISVFALARELGYNYASVYPWVEGQRLPGIVAAFRIEQYTKGEVPAWSWLDTPIGREQWKQRDKNWDAFAQERKAAVQAVVNKLESKAAQIEQPPLQSSSAFVASCAGNDALGNDTTIERCNDRTIEKES